MSIKLNGDISALKLGNTDVSKAYLGSTEVYSAASYFLDDHPNANLAVSNNRKLSSSYSGSIIRAYKAAGAAEQDIPFDGDIIDKSSLTTFANSGESFLMKMYDQSGNSRDVYNSVSVGYIPITDGSGNIFEDGGNVYGQVTSTNHKLKADSVTSSAGVITLFLVGRARSGSNQSMIISDVDGAPFVGACATGTSSPDNGAGTVTYYLNGSAISSPTRTSLRTALSAGFGVITVVVTNMVINPCWFGYKTSYGMLETMELFVYGSLSTAERESIENDLMTAYGI